MTKQFRFKQSFQDQKHKKLEKKKTNFLTEELKEPAKCSAPGRRGLGDWVYAAAAAGSSGWATGPTEELCPAGARAAAGPGRRDSSKDCSRRDASRAKPAGRSSLLWACNNKMYLRTRTTVRR